MTVRKQSTDLLRHGERLLPGLLFVGGQVEIWAGPLRTSRPTLTAVTTAAMAVVLWWRKRQPLAAATVIAVSIAAQATFGVNVENGTVFLFCVVIASYSIGAHGKALDVIVGLSGLGVAAAADVATSARGALLDDFMYVGFVLAAPCVAGRIARHRHNHVLQLQREASELRKAQQERAIRAAAEERARIARELHDIVAHSLAVMLVQAGAGEQMVDKDPPRASEALRAVQETGRQALADMRRLLGLLRDDPMVADLAPQPCTGDINRLVDDVRATGMEVDLIIDGEMRPLSLGVELAAYRVAQEALTNALKHSGARRACVRVKYESDALTVEVSDDGSGNGLDGNGGHGLVGMRERVTVHGGWLDVGSGPEGGFIVRAWLPLDRTDAP